VLGIEGTGPLAPVEGCGELVASQGERTETDHRLAVGGVGGERLMEERFSFRVVARVARFAHFLQIGLTQHGRGEPDCELIAAAQGVLKRPDAGVQRRLRPLGETDEPVNRRCSRCLDCTSAGYALQRRTNVEDARDQGNRGQDRHEESGKCTDRLGFAL
jgi:hypothetical protein